MTTQPPTPDVPEVSIDQAEQMIGKGAVALDVREPNETAEGIIPGAVLIPKDDVQETISRAVPDRAEQIVVYCAGGVRSAHVTAAMEALGYTRVASMTGGFNAWSEAGKPTAAPGA